MKPRFFFLTVSLIAVTLIVSCASVAVTESVPPVESASATEAVIPTNEAVQVILPETPDIQAVPTSRGPDLHATDPTTVSLASGQLQLVEFFRFT